VTDLPCIDQGLKVSRDAYGVVQLSGSHNSVTIILSGVQEARAAEAKPSASNLGPNPYQGLLAFDETTHHLFFGRETLSAELLTGVRRLLRDGGRAPRLLGILGPSGSGKSSVARAGLIPAIAGCDDKRLAGARVAVFRPGQSPVRALACALARIATGDPSPTEKTTQFEKEIRDRAAAGAHDGLTRLVDDLAEPQRPLILLADQFEETFTRTRPAGSRDAAAAAAVAGAREERDIFVAALRHAATAPHRAFLLVLTLRVDFFGELAEYPEFSRDLTERHVLVGPMLDDELRRAIAEPARRSGYTLPTGVVDGLISQVRDNPGALPLVQHALSRFWKLLVCAGGDRAREEEALATLNAIGPAMAETANEAMAGLDDAARELAWRAFTAGVQLGEGVPDTRRRVSFSEILPKGVAPTALRDAIEPFVAERLLSAGGDPSRPGEAWVEIAHEALIDHWRELRQRLTPKTRETLRLSQRAQEAAERWAAGTGDLWQGIDLALLRRLSREMALTEAQLKFLTASDERERETMRRERRVRLLTRAVAALMLVLGVVAAVAVYVVDDKNAELQKTNADLKVRIDKEAEALERAITSERLAIEQRNRALRTQVLYLASESEAATREGDAGTGLLLAMEALRDGSTVLTEGETWPAEWAAAQALQALRENAVLRGHRRPVRSVAFLDDDTRLASVDEDGTVRLWSVPDGKLIGEPLNTDQRDVRLVAFSSDGSRLAFAERDGTVRLWSVQDRQLIGEPLQTGQRWPRSMALSRDGIHLALADYNEVRLWSVPDRQPIGAPLRGHEGEVTALTFSGDGTRLASVDGYGTVRLWSVPDGKLIGEPLNTDQRRVLSVAFSSDGTRFASAGKDGTVRLWSVQDGKQIGLPLRGHEGEVTSVALSRDGTRLASAGEDGTVRLWSVQDRQLIGEPLQTGQRWPRSMALSRDGTHLILANYHKVRLWSVPDGKPIGEPLNTDQRRVLSVALSGDGTRLASAGEDGTVRFWSVPDRQPIGEPLNTGVSWPGSMALSRDGIHLAVADYNKVRLWSVPDGEPIGEPLTTGESWLRSLALSSDGTRLASVGPSGTVRLWSVQDRQPLGAPLQGLQNFVNLVAFSGDGTRLALAEPDGTVQLLPVFTSRARLMQAAEEGIVRCLSARQRVAYGLAAPTGDEENAPPAPPPPCWPANAAGN
jgi:WD40 repeat protein